MYVGPKNGKREKNRNQSALFSVVATAVVVVV